MSKKALFFSIIIIFTIQINCFSSFVSYSGIEENIIYQTEIYTQLWAISHPFQLKKALKITKHVLTIVDSVEKSGSLDGIQGGKLDAFRHVYWMALLGDEIGEKAALSLGNAHEKDNKRAFKKGKYFQDEKFSEMDVFNNLVGINLAKDNKGISKLELQNIIIECIKSGKVKIIKKDCNGNFLDKSGNILNVSNHSTWESNKCLVNSDYSPC